MQPPRDHKQTFDCPTLLAVSGQKRASLKIPESPGQTLKKCNVARGRRSNLMKEGALRVL